ncbi:hypothetical protein F4808DRAFT_455716 [Astrocystis sublimbata]|nr:hypothetical protein F4808DRAFT_455716 [Astrocystis sublimbata]
MAPFLPQTFRCRVCGKSKAPGAFSQSQLQKWYTKKKGDPKLHPDQAGLSCLDHLNEQRQIRCHGPCDRVKVVGQFSKNQRNIPEPWCVFCTEWRVNFKADDGPNNGRGVAFQGPGGGGNGESDDDDDDDALDDDVMPYGKLDTPVSRAIDRLEGYDDKASRAGTTEDAASVVNDRNISCWGDGTADGKSNFGSGSNAKAMTGTGSNAMQGRRAVAQVAMASGSGRQLASSNTTSNNRQSTSQINASSEMTRLARLTSGMDLGRESSQMSSSRLSAAQLGQGSQLTKENQEHDRSDNKKWYKGDNRKVFLEKMEFPAEMAQDGIEAAHDSDSPDEM